MSAQPIIKRPALRLIKGGDKAPTSDKIIINNSLKAAAAFRGIWNNETISKFESVYAIYLNDNKEILSYELLNIGTRSTSVINARAAVQYALANEDIWHVMIAHNHPSGSCEPSDADIEATKSLSILFRNVDVNFLDHIILTKGNYYSFADHNHIHNL